MIRSLKEFKDQMERTVVVNFPPKKIISLVPSQSELLHYLELEEETIGITKFCVHPNAWFRSKTRIGGTKTIDFEKIKSLQPDLIIGNKEENQQEQIEELEKHFPVWMSDIKNVADALEMIEKIGILTNRSKKSQELSALLNQQFSDYKSTIANLDKKRAAYFIWKDPYMVAAKGTFINEMLKISGFSNAFEHLERYPDVTLEDLKSQNPELVLLSSEPYPFKDKHIETFKKVCPNAMILVVDGELFSWYGSRLLDSIEYFKALKAQIW